MELIIRGFSPQNGRFVTLRDFIKAPMNLIVIFWCSRLDTLRWGSSYKHCELLEEGITLCWRHHCKRMDNLNVVIDYVPLRF